MFNDKSILITGATGSFGKEFVKTILKNYKPKRLIVYSRDELKQYEMKQKFDEPCMRYFIGDVRDYERLLVAMKDVDYVVHAAALKHVNIAEYNPQECIKTNIDGANNVVKASINSGVKRVIALSTDKAVDCINLYGATKIVSDKLFVAGNNISGKDGTIFSVVRYGNVMCSRGSVIPFFKKIADEGGAFLPITDASMTRFFITLKQSVNFVIDNFYRMQGGEVFIPKIPSMKIVDVASALAPNMPQKVVGIRAGEKLHEVLCSESDSEHILEFDTFYIIRPSIKFNHVDIDYTTTPKGEVGKGVERGFKYSSDSNVDFFTKERFLELVNDSL